ncbi:hypothetical protein VPH35_118246 [Triticum aestivum]
MQLPCDAYPLPSQLPSQAGCRLRLYSERRRGGTLRRLRREEEEQCIGEAKFLFIHDTIRIDSLCCDSEVVTRGCWNYFIGGVQFLDRRKVSLFLSVSSGLFHLHLHVCSVNQYKY